MLEKVDLSKAMEKAAYKDIIESLQLKLGELQRQAKALGIPVIVVFEGWDAAGKGTLINRLLLSLDPRGVEVVATNAPNEEERHRPFLWRFWVNTPTKGRMVIFDRSWYGGVLVERVDGIAEKAVWSKRYEEITSFERQLVDGGNVIIKFFLHISPKEQKRRFKKLQGNPSTAWKVTEDDWKHHRQYNRYHEAIEEMLTRTDTDFSPWTIVEAHDLRFATLKVFKTVLAGLQCGIKAKARIDAGKSRTTKRGPEEDKMCSSVLDQVDLSLAMTREKYATALKKYQKRIWELEHEVYIRRVPVIVVYEGCDAAGKGGNIKRFVQEMDPRGYEVIPVAAPNDVEKAHHYLWRFWMKVPKAGHIAIFDRSWYGRVLVERVEGFAGEAEWRRAYREIKEMEEQWVNFGAVVIKFWLQIGSDVQLERFQERQKNPAKRWKITEEDWRNREKSTQYKAAVDEMLYRTSTPHAPWTIVESNSKWYARTKVLRTVVERLEERLRRPVKSHKIK